MVRIDTNAIYALWLREMIRLRRAKSRIIGSMMLPLFFLIFLGFGFNRVQLGGLPTGVSYIQYLVPGIVGMSMLFSSSFAGLSVLWDREHGFLKEVMVAPVSRLSIVLGRIAGGGTMALIQGLLILLLSGLIGFHPTTWTTAPIALVFLVLISMTFLGIGLIFASKMEDAQGFGLIINLVLFPLFFLSGALYPVSSLPRALQYLVYLNPLTYGIDGLRATLLGASANGMLIDFLILIGFTVVFVGLGTYFFSELEVQ